MYTGLESYVTQCILSYVALQLRVMFFVAARMRKSFVV